MTVDTAFWRCGGCGTPNPSAGYITRCVACGAPRAAGRPDTPADRKPAPVAPPTPTRAARRPRPRITLALWAASVGYTLLVLAALAAIRLGLGPNWFYVPLLFTPRVAWFVPLVPLVAVAGWLRNPRLLGLLAAAAIVVAWPLMNLKLGWETLVTSPPAGLRLRVLNLNRGDDELDVPALIRLIERERVNVVFFQENGSKAALDEYFTDGWQTDPQKMVACRLPIVEVLPRLPDENLDQGRYSGQLERVRVKSPQGEFLLASTHLPTLRPGLTRALGGDGNGLDLLMPWWEREIGRVIEQLNRSNDLPYLVGGDFNMPAEHPMLAALGASHAFAFDEAGWGYGYTRPSRWPFVRIDQILASPEWQFVRCWVGPDVGSDHLPVLAEVVLPATAARAGATGP